MEAFGCINVLQYKSTFRFWRHLQPLPKSAQYQVIQERAHNRKDNRFKTAIRQGENSSTDS